MTLPYAKRAEIIYKEWVEYNLVKKHGRGYYESGLDNNILNYEFMWLPGLELLKKITQPRYPFGPKMEMLDYLLAHMPKEWDSENRALFAGSIIRYMAHLD